MSDDVKEQFVQDFSLFRNALESCPEIRAVDQMETSWILERGACFVLNALQNREHLFSHDQEVAIGRCIESKDFERARQLARDHAEGRIRFLETMEAWVQLYEAVGNDDTTFERLYAQLYEHLSSS